MTLLGIRWFKTLSACVLIAVTSIVLVSCNDDDDEDVPPLGVKATVCEPGDNPETGLQGQSTVAERTGGSAAKGINCNLKLVGQVRGEGAYHAQTWIDDCSYYSTAMGAQQQNLGVPVVDVSDPTKPVITAYLNAAGMLQTWESLKISTARKLLAAIRNGARDFSVYDISNCKRPVLLADVQLPDTAIRGHAGAMAPDGRTYYASTFPVSLAIIDLTNPSSPQLMTNWIPPNGVGQPHDLSISRDNNRAYIMQTTSGQPGTNGVVTLDVSDFNLRRANPQVRVVSTIYWPEASGAMTSEQITVKGKQFLLVSDEGQTGARAANCASGNGLPNTALFGFARLIDISDETKPVVTTKLSLEVDDPKNCTALATDTAVIAGGFGYSAHYCTADNRDDARLVACSRHEAGVRVYDISDLSNPKEIAYYKPPIRVGENIPGSGINGTANHMYDWNKSHSRFLNRNGRIELWTTSNDNGFQVLEFENNLKSRYGYLFEKVPTSLQTITVP